MYYDQSGQLRAIGHNGIGEPVEYDWSCSRDPRTGKEVGSWLKFSGALPYPVAPDAIAPEWVRRQFPLSGPPTPPSGCRNS
jgi:hypothetical protein